jgi:hypothetical protein
MIISSQQGRRRHSIFATSSALWLFLLCFFFSSLISPSLWVFASQVQWTGDIGEEQQEKLGKRKKKKEKGKRERGEYYSWISD